MSLPGLVLIVIALIVAVSISSHSSAKNAEKSRQEIASRPNPPEHEWIDNSPSGNTVAVCVVILVAAVLVALGH